MRRRCFSPKNADYKYYGGRGITVCARWAHFANFLADMGEVPAGLTIDRYPDNDGNYEPGNCRWATRKQQAETKRGNFPRGHKRTQGEKAPAAKLTALQVREIRAIRGCSQQEIAEKYGVSQGTISHLRRGKTWASVA